MTTIKHCGRHNNKKVAIVYKQVPGEDHMCLVLYTESMPSRLHDEVMKVIESAAGQSAKELADAMHRHIMADGTNCLNTVHTARLLQKVPTIQVVVTANSQSQVRLDILNDLLKKMESGEEATKQLADLDAQRGLANNQNQGRELGEPPRQAEYDTNALSAQEIIDAATASTSPGILSDADIAQQRTTQASKLRAEAQGMLNEAIRLEQEAAVLVPTTQKKSNARKPKTKTAA